jgi:hypothetical protein
LVDGEAAVAEIEAAAELRAAVDLQCGGACGGARRMWERGRVKGQPQGSLGGFIERERREGTTAGVMAINGHGGGLDCIKGSV